MILEASRPVIITATLLAGPAGDKYAVEIELDPEFPGIKANPDRFSGQPTFEGRRVGVVTIAGMVAAGEPRADIAAGYRLSLARVDAAVRYTTKHGMAA